MTIAEGALVSFEYTLSDEDGSQIESNIGKDPLEYTHGIGQIIPGLEKELEGLNVGDTKIVTVAPGEGYGEIDPEAKIDVPKAQVPEDAHVVGAMVQTMSQDGQAMFARVAEIKDEDVVLDFNPPLAGKTLTFDVKILEITPGTCKE